MLCYLSLGSNLGDRAGMLSQAIAALDAHPQVSVRRVSPVYKTKALADEPQPDYLNLALVLETVLEPEQLLALAHEIEARLGRERPYRNAPRTIDIDLLVCATDVAAGGIMSDQEHLRLPHPEMLRRQFVLQPLADLAPDLRVGGSMAMGELVDRSDPEVRRVGELAELVARP